MTTLYFGPHWGVPALDGARQVPTPVGQRCAYCTLPIVDGDIGYLRAHLAGPHEAQIKPGHAECEGLGVFGCLVGVCQRHGGWDVSEGEPMRAAALEAWRRLADGWAMG